MHTVAAPAPLSAPEQVTDLADGRITTVTEVSLAEPCFAGHYPNFPILPGVLLVEMVWRAVCRYAVVRLSRSAVPHHLHRVCFQAPVLPGDTVTTDCRLTETTGLIEVTARCRTERGQAATVHADFELR